MKVCQMPRLEQPFVESDANSIIELKTAIYRAEWDARCERWASYAGITGTFLTVCIGNLLPVFKALAVRNHIGNSDAVFTLNQDIQFNQMLGVMILFLTFRLVAVGLLTIPRWIFCETAFPNKFRNLFKCSIDVI